MPPQNNSHLDNEKIQYHGHNIQQMILVYANSHDIENCCLFNIFSLLLSCLAVHGKIPLDLVFNAVKSDYDNSEKALKMLEQVKGESATVTEVKFYEA